MWFNLAKKNHPFDHTAFALGTENKGVARTYGSAKINSGRRFVFFTLTVIKAVILKKKKLSMCFSGNLFISRSESLVLVVLK